MNERGSITFGPIVGVIVIILAFIGLLAVCNDSDDNVDGLGRITLVSHERSQCYDDYDCDDYGRGGDGGSSGGHQGYGGGGGRGGADYDGDGDGNRCRNFCIYGLPAPGEGGKK